MLDLYAKRAPDQRGATAQGAQCRSPALRLPPNTGLFCTPDDGFATAYRRLRRRAAACGAGWRGVHARRAARGAPPCATHTFEGSRFIVCRFDARHEEMRLASRDANGAYMRGFEALGAALGPDARRVRFAMNAGMFNAAGAPIGLYVEDGDAQHATSLTDGPGNFHMKPNGVFWQDHAGALHLSTSDDYAAAAPTPRWATQSGPMLLINGALHPRFQHDGPSRNIRNGVGLADAHTAYFVISSGVVSFGRFARFFRDELGCTDALYFDGGVSSLWAPHLNRRDDASALGPMVVALSR